MKDASTERPGQQTSYGRMEPINLPYWKGIQDRPGYETVPFGLSVQRGLIRLELGGQDVGRIVAGYSGRGYQFPTTRPGHSAWGNRRGDVFVQELARQVGDLSGKTVLEIGAGSLYMAKQIIKELHARHYIACDPALQSISSEPPIEILPEYFSDASFSNRRIDLVVMPTVLEHVPDPFKMLTEVRQILDASGGGLYVVVPDCERRLRIGDWGECIHEHLSYFTRESLVATMASVGFRADGIQQADGSLMVLARPGHGVRVDEQSESRQVKLVEEFKVRSQGSLEYARGLLSEADRTGGRWGIHGCAAGLNNLFALLDLHSHPALYLFDGDAAKTGKYLPAFDRPILSSHDRLYRSMEGVLIAATNFYDEILAGLVREHGIAQGRIRSLIPLGAGS